MMPAYNFKKDFVEMIRSGEKPHTIRRKRKRPTVVGDRLYLYSGMRTKACEKIAETRCVAVMPVVIYPKKRMLYVCDEYGVPMRVFGKGVAQIARDDGFSGPNAFFDFFLTTYGEGKLDDFEMIYWDVREVLQWNVEKQVQGVVQPPCPQRTSPAPLPLKGHPHQMATLRLCRAIWGESVCLR